MDLYKIKKNTLEPIERDPFKLEREIQSVVETNVETLSLIMEFSYFVLCVYSIL